MKQFAILVLAAALGTQAFAVTLYDRLDQTYVEAGGCWDGGINDLGDNEGLQIGQRVTGIAGGEVLTRVSGRFLEFTDSVNATGALVQVFNLSGNAVGALVGEQTLSVDDTVVGPDQVLNLGLTIHQIDAYCNIAGLTAGADYLVVLQGQGPYWGYLGLNDDGNQNTFLRDYSSFGYPGGYGFTDWMEQSAAGYASGDASLLVEGSPVPEPATLAALGLGALAMLRRRKKA